MSPKSRRRALIVTSSEFEDPTFKQLTAPGNDADALAVVLADPEIGDFQVETLANLPYAELRREIERFYRQGLTFICTCRGSS